MKIQEFINQYKNHPILFMGTGISLRYYENSYTWDQLLSKLSFELHGDKEAYLNLKYENKNDLPQIASILEKRYDEILKEDRNGKFKFINDIFFEKIENDSQPCRCSRMKLYISYLLANLKIKDSKDDEIQALIRAKKNICSIITTNYDTFIEDYLKFIPLVGNDIILSNPYGSVYKIHGSITSPESLVITSDDYKSFNVGNELIKAQLVSLFIHHPIIFLGYGMNDDDIKSILEIIFKYVTPNTEEAELIQRNFLLVDYKEGSKNNVIEDYTIILQQNKSIRINKLITDDFTTIYTSIANLKLPVTVMDIRKVETVIRKIVETNSDDAIQVRITDDIDSLENKDTILAIGSEDRVKYEYFSINEMLLQYFDIIDKRKAGILSLIDKHKIQSTQYFPIFGFLTINDDIKAAEKLKQLQNKKIDSCITQIHDGSKIRFSNIEGILSDTNIAQSNKDKCIFWNVFENNINTDDLKSYLMSYPKKSSTDYRKLLCIYDKKKYDK